MKTASLNRMGTCLIGATLVFVQNAAQACAGCKQTDGAPLSGASIGFGWDIGLMLVLLGSLLGGLSYMIYQSCRALAERDRFLESQQAMSTGGAA